MNSFPRITISLIIALFVSKFLYAQDITQSTIVCNELQTMFANLDMDSSRVPTGYLLDRAFEVTNVRNYNGAALLDSNYVDVNVLRNILLTINSSIVNSAGSSIDANTFVDNLADTTSVVLGAVAFQYNYIVSNALTDNLIVYQNGLVYNSYINDILQYPFATDNVFAFTPNRSTVSGPYVRFRFSASNFVGNITPVSYEFDNGSGTYSPITLPFDSTIEYTTTGVKELRMRINFSNQTILESHSHIEILPHSITPAGAFTQPDTVKYFSHNYLGEQVSAIVSIKYKTSGANLTNPFIYVEGFDDIFVGTLTNIIGLFGNSSGSINFNSNRYFNSLMLNISGEGTGALSFQDLYDNSNISESFKQKYDILYVDWGNPLADIRANAYLLEDIISWINSKKDPIGSSRNIVFGHSMGGLVARYALRDMEIHSTPHQTSYYVSHDSPHLGANVPLGALYSIRDIYRLLYGESYNNTGILTFHLFDALLLPLTGVLESTSARQMLYYYVKRNGDLDNEKHNEWQAILEEIGFPKGDYGYPIENLCIVNGGSFTNSLADKIAHLRVNIGNNAFGFFRILLGLLTSLNNIDASFDIYRNKGGSQLVSKSAASYNKEFLWITFKKNIPLISETNHYAPSGSLRLDAADASTLQIENTTIVRPNGADTVSLFLTKPLSFIPTASALAVNDYFTHFISNPPQARIETPFDSYILRDTAQIHMYNNSSQWSWVDEMTGLSISWPSGIALTGDIFTVSSGNYGSNPQWNISNPAIANISGGILSVTTPGLITISFTSNDDGYYYCKHKTFIAGGLPPDLYLSAISSGLNYYTVTAQCSSQQSNNLLDEMAGNGQIEFVWGTKDSNGSINWNIISTSRTININASDGTKVYLKIRDSNGRECNSESLFTELSPFPIYFLSYAFEPEVVYTLFGSVWCVYDTVSDPGEFVYDPVTGSTTFNSDNYLMVWPENNGVGQIPDRIIIDGQTIMRDRIIYQYINNTLTPIYCFKLLDSTYVQSVISNISSYPSHSAVVTGFINNGNSRIRRFSVTITQGLPPL